MKKGYKECPFCANEIKEDAIKCQYCHEFLNNKNNENISKEGVKDNSKNGIKSKGWRTVIFIYFILTIPIFIIARFAAGDESGIWYVLVPIIYIVLTDILRGGVYYIDSGKYQLGIWNKIKSLIN